MILKNPHIFLFSTMPLPKCACNLHHTLTQHITCTPHISKISSRKFPKASIDALITAGHLSSRSLYICTVCGEHGNMLLDNPPPPKQCKFDSTTPQTAQEHYDTKAKEAKKLVQQINEGYFKQDQLAQLTHAIGTSQNLALHTESIQLGQMYKNALSPNCDSTFVEHSNKVVSSFLQGACNLSTHSTAKDRQDSLKHINIMENIYHTRNHNFIGPSSFKAHLLSYFHCKSKSASTILSKFGPFGSYTTLLNWLAQQGTQPIAAPDTDILTFVDNNQNIGRTHHISLNSTIKSSTITTLIHIHAQGTGMQQIQKDAQLSPAIRLQDISLANHHDDWKRLQTSAQETLW